MADGGGGAETRYQEGRRTHQTGGRPGDQDWPEYVAMMDGLSQIDENSGEGKQIEAALASLEKLCR